MLNTICFISAPLTHQPKETLQPNIVNCIGQLTENSVAPIKYEVQFSCNDYYRDTTKYSINDWIFMKHNEQQKDDSSNTDPQCKENRSPGISNSK